MKNRHKRMILVGTGMGLLIAATALVLSAFRDNLVFFYSPTQVAANEAPQGRAFRIGGLVKEGSVVRGEDGFSVNFVVTDTLHDIPVVYTGALPDLFSEGKGVVTQGTLDQHGAFTASEVLAKHDENYMPHEAADAIEKATQARNKAASATMRLPES